MNPSIHPTKEELISYLYSELAPERHAQCRKHLAECKLCAAVVESWEASAEQLNAYQVPPLPRARPTPVPALKWAMAALFMLGFGLAVGRLSNARSATPETMMASVTPIIRAQLQREMQEDLAASITGDSSQLTNQFRREMRVQLNRWSAALLAASRNDNERVTSELAQTFQTAREQDQQQVINTVRTLDAQRRTEIASLRRDVETMAVVAQNRLDETDNQLGNLATLSLAGGPRSTP